MAVWHIEKGRHSGTKLNLVVNINSNNKLKKENSVFIKLVYLFQIYNNKEKEKEEAFEQSTSY